MTRTVFSLATRRAKVHVVLEDWLVPPQWFATREVAERITTIPGSDPLSFACWNGHEFEVVPGRIELPHKGTAAENP